MNNLESATSSSSVPRWLHATIFLCLLFGLSLSRPTAEQFNRQIWLQALNGMKVELSERREHSPAFKTFEKALNTPIISLIELLKAGKDAEMNHLPSFWMEHTTVYDWKIATYFRYDQADCFSDYLGIAGTVVNLGDGCKVEPLRKKGGAGPIN